MHSAVEREIRQLIRERGRITFAQFMQVCLYSPRGGFYAARSRRINAHFGTAPTSHPAFGTLIARQLEQMWHLLGEPAVFHLIEVGSGDGALARAIAAACARSAPALARALCYVAVDYQPRWPPPDEEHASTPEIRRVQTAGLAAFRNLVGCILSNELLDNFPVHRFAVQDGKVKEVFVTSIDGGLAEVLDQPSSPHIERRLTSLGVALTEGQRGEVNLAMEDWIVEIAAALERGFVLTIDYGLDAADLYSPQNDRGAMVCYRRHAVEDDPYRALGEQDITCLVDFTSLMRLGERHGLTTLGYGSQRRFLMNLGYSSLLDAVETRGLSPARATLERMAMNALVDPEEYGDFKVLAQAKGPGLAGELLGFRRGGT